MRYGWSLAFAINILAIILLFMAYLAWYVSPLKTTIFSYIGLGFPFVLLFNILFFFFWLICRKWIFLLISFISLISCIRPITTYFPLNISTKPIPENSIKVLSYNVRGFNGHKDRNKPNEENKIIEYIRDSGADIVCLQEFIAFKDNGKANLKNIQKRLKHYPYMSVVDQRHDKSHVYGIACFSKYPITNATDIPYISVNGSALFQIDINGKNISFLVNHLLTNSVTNEDRKMYQQFFRESNAVTIDDIAHNIKDKLGIAYRKRATQSEMLEGWIKKQNGDGIVVCGDFNDTPISYTYRKMKGDLVDAYVENEFGPQITYHENLFWFKIDFILHSKNIKSYNCVIDKVKYSDHYPIWSYMKIE